MQITVHTDRGTFIGKRNQLLSPDEMAYTKALLADAAQNGAHLTLETETGYVVLGKELLRTAAFVVEV